MSIDLPDLFKPNNLERQCSPSEKALLEQETVFDLIKQIAESCDEKRSNKFFNRRSKRLKQLEASMERLVESYRSLKRKQEQEGVSEKLIEMIGKAIESMIDAIKRDQRKGMSYEDAVEFHRFTAVYGTMFFDIKGLARQFEDKLTELWKTPSCQHLSKAADAGEMYKQSIEIFFERALSWEYFSELCGIEPKIIMTEKYWLDPFHKFYKANKYNLTLKVQRKAADALSKIGGKGSDDARVKAKAVAEAINYFTADTAYQLGRLREAQSRFAELHKQILKINDSLR